MACGVAAWLCLTQGPAAAQEFFPAPGGEKSPGPLPWQERGLRAALADASPEVRWHAVRFITGKGWAAGFFTLKDLRPMLYGVDGNVSYVALEGLAQLGPEAAPCAREMVPLLRHASSGIRGDALVALGRMGREAAPYAREIVPLLQDPEITVCAAAEKALSRLGRVAPATVSPFLQPLLADTRSAEERDAAKAPPKAADPFGPLSPDQRRGMDLSQLRCSAVRALGGMGAEAAPHVLPLLQPLLRDEDAAVRSLAQSVVASLKGEAASDADPGSSEPAAPASGCSAEEVAQADTSSAPKLLRSLLPRLQDPDPTRRLAAAKALKRAGVDTEAQIFGALLSLLKDADRNAKMDAAQAFQNMGKTAAPFAKDLLPLLQESDPQMKIHAMYALTRMGDATAPMVARALLPLLQSEDYEVKTVAVNTLGLLGPAAAPVALPALLPLLEGEDTDLRERTILALGNMGAGAAPAARALVALLKDPEPRVREPAAEALGQLGPAAMPLTVPALIAAFSADDIMLGYHSQAALEHLGHEAAPLTLATALARYPQASADEKRRLCDAIDLWGNLNGNPAWHCAALVAADTAAGQDELQALRFHLHLWSGHDEALLLSVRWLGKPAADPMPAKGAALSVAEQQAVLHMLLILWPHSASYPALRVEMAGRIVQVAQGISAAPDEAVSGLLKKIGEQLKADAIKESQQASGMARQAVEKVLAAKKAA